MKRWLQRELIHWSGGGWWESFADATKWKRKSFYAKRWTWELKKNSKASSFQDFEERNQREMKTDRVERRRGDGALGSKRIRQPRDVRDQLQLQQHPKPIFQHRKVPSHSLWTQQVGQEVQVPRNWERGWERDEWRPTQLKSVPASLLWWRRDTSEVQVQALHSLREPEQSSFTAEKLRWA